MLPLVRELGRGVQADRSPVDPDPREPRGPQLVPEFGVGLAVPPLDRGHHEEFGAFGGVEDLLDDLVGGLRPDRDVALGAVRLAQPGEEDP